MLPADDALTEAFAISPAAFAMLSLKHAKRPFIGHDLRGKGAQPFGHVRAWESGRSLSVLAELTGTLEPQEPPRHYRCANMALFHLLLGALALLADAPPGTGAPQPEDADPDLAAVRLPIGEAAGILADTSTLDGQDAILGPDGRPARLIETRERGSGATYECLTASLPPEAGSLGTRDARFYRVHGPAWRDAAAASLGRAYGGAAAEAEEAGPADGAADAA